MVKKYRLVPEKEYMLWKKYTENNDASTTDESILDSKLPDDVKIKLFQDQKRIECNERDKADLLLKMGAYVPPKLIKDAEVQYESTTQKDSSCGNDADQKKMDETSSIPTPPPLPSSTTTTTTTRKRKTPPVDLTCSTEFQKQSMRKIARFLSECGITGNDKGQVLINNKAVPGADYVTTIRQLADARMRRSESTMQIVGTLQKFDIPEGVFSTTIMNLFSKNASDDKSVKWDAF